MRLEPIVKFVEQNTTLTQGVDLFLHSMPPTVREGVLIVTENAGNQVDHEIKGVFKGRFQVITRGVSYGSASDRSYELFDLLTMLEKDLTDYVVTYSRPRHTPNPIGGRSKGDLIEMSTNFDFRYRTV